MKKPKHISRVIVENLDQIFDNAKSPVGFVPSVQDIAKQLSRLEICSVPYRYNMDKNVYEMKTEDSPGCSFNEFLLFIDYIGMLPNELGIYIPGPGLGPLLIGKNGDLIFRVPLNLIFKGLFTWRYTSYTYPVTHQEHFILINFEIGKRLTLHIPQGYFPDFNSIVPFTELLIREVKRRQVK